MYLRWTVRKDMSIYPLRLRLLLRHLHLPRLPFRGTLPPAAVAAEAVAAEAPAATRAAPMSLPRSPVRMVIPQQWSQRQCSESLMSGAHPPAAHVTVPDLSASHTGSSESNFRTILSRCARSAHPYRERISSAEISYAGTEETDTATM